MEFAQRLSYRCVESRLCSFHILKIYISLTSILLKVKNPSRQRLAIIGVHLFLLVFFQSRRSVSLFLSNLLLLFWNLPDS